MNYVFKVFATKFLSLYIDNFEKSCLQLYQGSLNLQKVQLKLSTINKLFNELLLPFTIIKADLDQLKIDIPWSSLSTQPIKTIVSGLNIILEYRPIQNVEKIIEDIRNKVNDSSKLTIQSEIRKYKEIDEQMLKKFLKKLLLNLSFQLKDVQIELLIKQEYRLQVICQELKTFCVDSFKLNPEDTDQFHRISDVDTFLIKLIRYRDADNSYSNQQLVALDQCQATFDRGKDKIFINIESNNVNLIVEKDILTLVQELLQNQQDLQEQVQERIKEEQVQPSWESIILQDIISVNKGVKIYIVMNNTFIQYHKLSIFVNSLELQIKTTVPLSETFNIKLRYKQIDFKHNSNQILLISECDEVQKFSVWPELVNDDSEQQIMIDCITKYQERLKKCEQSCQITLRNNNIQINYCAIAQELNSILILIDEITQLMNNQSQKVEIANNSKQVQRTHQQQYTKELQISALILKFGIQIRVNQQHIRLLLQTHIHSTIRIKNNVVKAGDGLFELLQLTLIDHNGIIISQAMGLNTTVVYQNRQLKVDIQLELLTMRIYYSIILFLLTLPQLEIDNHNKQAKQKMESPPLIVKSKSKEQIQLQINLTIPKLELNVGEVTMSNQFYSYLILNCKAMQTKINIGNKSLNEFEFRSKLNAWSSHPMSLQQYKFIKTFQIRIDWNKQNPTNNSLQIISGIHVKLSQQTISNLVNVAQLLNQQSLIFQFHNSTQRTILIRINNQNTNHQIELVSQQYSTLPALYYNQAKETNYQHPRIQLGLYINDTLTFWSKEQTFNPNQQYFSQFVIIDTFDQIEYDFYIKANKFELNITQKELFQLEVKPKGHSIINNTNFTLHLKVHSCQEIFVIQAQQQMILPIQINDDEQLTIKLQTQNVQEIKLQLKDLLHLKGILSFNFVKIDQNLYNILLVLENDKSKGNSTNILRFKPYFNFINLLPWSFKVDGQALFHLPISVDATMNNQILNVYDENLDEFFNKLLESRRSTVNQPQQISIDDQMISQYLINFLREGRYAIEYKNNHHMLMIFRNNSLIDNQMCFILCRNVYQSSIKYLLLRNRTDGCFVLMKNKSRLHISPNSENCFEYNVAKGEKCRLFGTDQQYDLLQLLDYDTMVKLKLKVNKFQVGNIHLIDIFHNQEKSLSSEFKIILPSLKIDIDVCDKQIIQVELDINVRFFTKNHLDILIQNITVLSDNKIALSIHDCFSIVETSASTDLKLLIIYNFFLKLKEIKVHVNQQFISDMKLLAQLIKADSLGNQNAISYDQSWGPLGQSAIIVINTIVEPITIDINIQTTMLQLQNSVQMPQFQIKMKKFSQASLKQEAISFYIAYLIAKIPTVQMFITNLRNPISMLLSGRTEQQLLQPHYFYITQAFQYSSIYREEYILIKRCYTLNDNNRFKKSVIIVDKQQLIVLNGNTIVIPLDSIGQIHIKQELVIIYNTDVKQIMQIKSKNVRLIIQSIKQVLY